MAHTEGPDWDRAAEGREIAHEAAKDRAEIRRLRVALMKVKELVVGDKIHNWQDNYRTTNTRSQIADLCDLALKD